MWSSRGCINARRNAIIKTSLSEFGCSRYKKESQRLTNQIEKL